MRPIAPFPSRILVHRLLAAILFAVLALAALNLSPLMRSWTVQQLFDVNGEITLCVWLSSALLLATGAVAMVCGAYERLVGGAWQRVGGWLTIGALFLLLSLDETASVHERMGMFVSEHLFQSSALPGVFLWVLVFLPFGIVVAAALVYWLVVVLGWRHDHSRFGLAAIAIWALVPLLEALDPALGAPRWLLVTEESAEFVGEALMLSAVLLYLGHLQIGHPLTVAVGDEGALDDSVAAGSPVARRVA